ncbi:winged helix-turn-helix domain-containing protein [Devosia sp. CN2-171]|jgi:DNA-binding winged helix-turn-helix (wHTH) protein|uniref:winged helix-turn-helix domain-containing protein n=1 Tax=Devosia sp. CN2-171 TaxID=3400909 RepID=UPI003BF81AB4
MADLQFGDLIFEESLISARDIAGGGELTFTRAERAVLSALMAHPRRVLSRSALLDSMSGIGSDTSDRNVDFVINRLRLKLGDPARSPRFIATRYGEGYVWVAEPSQPAEALVVVGPVHGLARAGALESVAKAFVGALLEQLDAATSPGQRIRLDERYSPTAGPGAKSQFSVEVSLFPGGGQLHCALVLRRAQGEVIGSSRLVVSDRGQVAHAIAGAVQEFRSLIWHQHVLSMVDAPVPAAPPIYVAMHDAGRLLTADTRSWIESADQVRAALEANPNDPQTRLMWGLSLYVQVIMGTGGQILPDDQRLPIEDEIEAAALGALPGIADNAMLKLSAAKLLLFLARDHAELAERLADEAFESSTAFAASFAILGQARLMRGRLAEGMDLLERGLEIAEPGTEFSVYIMVLLCGGKLAARDFVGLTALLTHLHEVSPITRVNVAPFCVLAHEPLSPQNHAILSGMGEERARRSLEYIHMTSARQYEDRVLQGNVLRGFAHHLVRLYGPDVVPPHIRAILEPAE